MKATKEHTERLKKIAAKLKENNVMVRAQCSKCRLMSEIEISKEAEQTKRKKVTWICKSELCNPEEYKHKKTMIIGVEREFIIHWA